MNPRHDFEAEAAVLSAMLHSPDMIEDVSALLTAEDFYRPSHSTVFRAVTWLHGKGQAADTLSVADALDRRGQLAAIGGKAALLDIAGASPTPHNALSHARIVFREAVFRRLNAAGSRIAAIDGTDPDEAVSQAARMVEAAAGPERSEAVPLRAALDSACKAFESPSETVRLDEWDLHVDFGSVVIVGARPSVGKTAFLVSEMCELAKRHLRCRIYSYEMSERQITTRIVNREAGVSAAELRRGIGADGVRAVMRSFEGDMADFISIDGAPGSIDRLTSDIRRFGRAGGKCVFVDYLQLISEQTTEAATENSRRLKIAAGQAGVVLMCASQLSRDGKQADGTFRRPSVGDLRQTGAIEQDADVVLLLHGYDATDTNVRDRLRAKGYLLEHDDPALGYSLGHVDVAKTRNVEGALGERYARFDGLTWTQLDRTGDGRPL